MKTFVKNAARNHLESWVETVTWTKEEARAFLDKHKYKERNRKISPRYVDRYRREMDSSNWHDDGSVIKIDCDGFMIEGQHRVLAFLASNLEMIQFHVIHNVEKGGGFVPAPKQRSTVDALTSAGVQTSAGTAAAIKAFAKYLNGSDEKVDEDQLINLIYVFGDEMEDACKKCQGLCAQIRDKKKKPPLNIIRVGKSYSASFAVGYLISKEYGRKMEETVDRMFRAVLAGEIFPTGMVAETQLFNGLASKDSKTQNKISVDSFVESLMDIRFGKDAPAREQIVTHFKEIIKNEQDANSDAGE